ncbi:NADP oxidoreductase coenzyme [Sphingomonas sp. PAMC26645]|uniref:NADPH-dependent F420 reductase n=1 Tax=Sphingomonas sp. PAMC26645 TaxID=2565555 RepID=UPI00109DA99D|nr:NAD(P)-binding domain-containing protein [Sphingomonas sp. PAMC26645]QCB43300.1 NADP oxidoreductase coenzyme [Sphingomonas sp. PAMC26645]
MSYAIIGFGQVGQALAGMFARKGIEVAVATTRPPEAIADKAREIGATVVAKSLSDAITADIVLLAVPFWSHRDVAKAAPDWAGKTIIDVTNAYGFTPEEMDNLPASVVVAKAFNGAKLVKAFNHLAAPVLAKDPAVNGGRRVIFFSSDDDEGATKPVVELIEKLGFAPVSLGTVSDGGTLVQARGKTWGPLNFQDLVKFE